MNRKDWQILAGVLVGGVGGIATALVLMRWVQPDSISSFIVVGAIVLIAMLMIQFIRLRRRRVGDGR
jgi:hypothetical protein